VAYCPLAAGRAALITRPSEGLGVLYYRHFDYSKSLPETHDDSPLCSRRFHLIQTTHEGKF